LGCSAVASMASTSCSSSLACGAGDGLCMAVRCSPQQVRHMPLQSHIIKTINLYDNVSVRTVKSVFSQPTLGKWKREGEEGGWRRRGTNRPPLQPSLSFTSPPLCHANSAIRGIRVRLINRRRFYSKYGERIWNTKKPILQG